MAERYRIGEVVLDTGSGELRPASDPDAEPLARLSPQPARLLALLAGAGGELVSRESIRREIWNDVEIEFEPSLHFCVRQIRAALGDSASSPRYVETLPRRGYRLLVPVERLDASADGVHATGGPQPAAGLPDERDTRVTRLPRRGLLGAVAVLVLLAAGLLVARGVSSPTPEIVRIGVMPFERPGDRPNDVAETIVERLTLETAGRAEIVGPTTTGAYDPGTSLRALAAEDRLAYLVNARFLDDGRVLAELVRASDGAHVWVKAYQELAPARVVGEEISRGVLMALELASEQSPS